MLSALSALLVVHQTQAENAPRVSWISPTAFSPKPLKLAMEIDENRAGTINSVQGLVRVMPGTDLTQPADPKWADRLDALYGPEKREK